MDLNQQTQLNEKSKGLYGKYCVSRIDGKPLKGDYCIVLEIDDPNTWGAIAQFAIDVKKDGYDKLSEDLFNMLNWVTQKQVKDYETRDKKEMDKGS